VCPFSAGMVVHFGQEYAVIEWKTENQYLKRNLCRFCSLFLNDQIMEKCTSLFAKMCTSLFTKKCTL